jgi:hypothetical protein
MDNYRAADWPISPEMDIKAYHEDVCGCGERPAKCTRFSHAELAYRAGKRTGMQLLKDVRRG